MIICQSVTIPTANAGHRLIDLLAAVVDYIPGPTNRVACLRISYLGANQVFLVPKTGAYTPVLTKPPSFGWDFKISGVIFDQTYPGNFCSLEDFNLSTDTAGQVVQVFAYSV